MALSRRSLTSDTNTTNGATTISLTPSGVSEGDWIEVGGVQGK